MRKNAEGSLQLQATVLESIARGETLKETLNLLCELVEGTVGDAICSAMLLDPATGMLNVFSAPNASPELIGKLNGLVPSDLAGSCGTAVHQRQAVFVKDALTDYRWQPLRSIAETYGIAACWSVPVYSRDDQVLGSFAISRLNRGNPSAFAADVLVTASHIASIAIEHFRSIDALQASEAKFRDLYNHAPIMFVSIDEADQTITECNLALTETLGYSKEELLGRYFYDIWAPTCEMTRKLSVSSYAKSNAHCSDGLWLASSNGDQIDISLSITTVRNEDQKAIGSLWAMRDISEFKRAQEDVQHRAQFQSLLVDLSSTLLRAKPDNHNRQLSHCLGIVGAAYKLDAISLWWFSQDGNDIRRIDKWERGGRDNIPDYPNWKSSRWMIEHLHNGRCAAIEDTHLLPETSASGRQEFLRYAVKSLLMIPMFIDDKPEGVAFFTTHKETRSWPEASIAELKLATESLAGAIARAEAMAKIEQLKDQLQDENAYLKEEIRAATGFSEIIGNNSQLRKCLQLVEKVAPTDVSVLILGQTGTGKELIARALHRLSDRRDSAMMSVNCPALPANLIESELFGHEKGAFTGAHMQRRGRFERANGGTLFLDELGDLPLELQSKLLRVLQSGEFERLGGSETLQVDVRLIAATNRDLKQAVQEGTFRADLYYRIGNFPIHLPALCERRSDISLLAEHFVGKHRKRLGKNITSISPEMLQEMLQYSWPGNVRELESIVERALISSTDNGPLRLPISLQACTGSSELAPMAFGERSTNLSNVERSHILRVLEQTEWMIAGATGAASALGVPPSTLRSKMKRLGISRKLV